MTVWHLIAAMRTERETVEQTAENFGLPLEAVLEAMHYYALHKDVVEADVEEEKRILVEEFGDVSGVAMSFTIYLDDCSDHNRLIHSLTQAGHTVISPRTAEY